MAEIHSTVEEAQKAIWGATAEAQALIELYRTASCDSSVATLAMSILERYVSSLEDFETSLYRHGFPPLPLQSQPSEGSPS